MTIKRINPGRVHCINHFCIAAIDNILKKLFIISLVL